MAAPTSAVTTGATVRLVAASPAAATAPPGGYVLGLKILCAGFAGVIGSAVVFPMDTVKTHLQGQSKNPAAPKQYSGILDCFKKIHATKGTSGFYNGIRANLIGVFPEKAIKIGVNDYLRDRLADSHGVVSMPKGALAGAMAGFCQLVITNPMEVVKIRLQTSTESGARGSLGFVVKELGFRGLYTGAAATLLRDIPFSVIFFCLYGQLKDTWATDANGQTNFLKVLVSGFSAGAIAASLSTPADFVKTNLQMKGATQKTIMGQIRHTLSTQGPAAFLEGVGPRCLIIGPLFALTLASYEVQKYIMEELGWTPRQAPRH